MLKLAAIIVALVLLVIAIELPNPFHRNSPLRTVSKNPVAEKPLWKELEDDESDKTYTAFKL